MWINLEDSRKITLLEQVSNQTGLPTFVIEKDWWVCLVLKAVFQSKYKDSIIFKGGTSLSKAYNLIERFSEDIDYSSHKKGSLHILPPNEVIKDWESDYRTMQENMISGKSLKWEELMKRIKEIQYRFNNIT